MEEIQHFIHEHPLSFSEGREVDDEGDHKDRFCNICGLPILGSPSYTCSNGCKFFLHKPCAQLPQTLRMHRYHPIHDIRFTHTLCLKPKGDSNYFTYKCESCEFDLHPLLAEAVEIKIRHRSHSLHPLVAICKEILCRCDVCGEEKKGFFFSCQECNFWIHPDCTTLSTILELSAHPHPLILMHTLSNISVLDADCIICKRSKPIYTGAYLCIQCGRFAHVSCAKSNTDRLETEKISLELPDKGDTFPSLVIRKLLDRLQNNSLQIICHDHPLKSCDDEITNSSREACNLVCDVCVQPISISSPFYACLDCHFLVHSVCAILPPTIIFQCMPDFTFQPDLDADPSEYKFFQSIFFCIFCHRPSNGFCCVNNVIKNKFMLLADLECMASPQTIKHASHGQHLLFQIRMFQEPNNPLSCCSRESSLGYDLIYKCTTCDFYIHVGCALLPKRTHHKFDEHPLELIMKSNEQDQYKCCLCEVCEKDINKQYWYYGCEKCEHYFHINCIPSVGHLSKVKFGGTLLHDNNKIHPEHPHRLTLTRMLTVESHEKCGYCKQIIQGFVDQMAFHCSECDFWIHFSCARNSCASQLRTYWEVEEETQQFYREMIHSVRAEVGTCPII